MGARYANAIRRAALTALVILALLLVPGAWAGSWSETLTAGVNVRTASQFRSDDVESSSATACPGPVATSDGNQGQPAGNENSRRPAAEAPAEESPVNPACQSGEGLKAGEGDAQGDRASSDDNQCHDDQDDADLKHRGRDADEDGWCEQEHAGHPIGDTSLDGELDDDSEDDATDGAEGGNEDTTQAGEDEEEGEVE